MLPKYWTHLSSTGVWSSHHRLYVLMAKEECISQRNKTAGDTSALRNRKVFPSSEKTPSSPLSKGTHSQTAGHHSEDDAQSSNGTSAQCSTRGNNSEEPPSRVLLMLAVGLSFSTRLYKIADPPHVWWVKVPCDALHLDLVHFKCADFCTWWHVFLVFQLGRDALWEDGKLLHQQDLLFRCPSSSWKSETAFCA